MCVCVRLCVCCYVLTSLICVVYAFAPDLIEAWCIAQRHGLMKFCQVAKTASAEIAGLLVSLKDQHYSRCVLASDVQ